MANLTVHLEASGSWERGKKLLASKGVQSAFLLNANPEQVQYALDNTTGIVVVRIYDIFNERSRIGDDFEKDIVFRHIPSEFLAMLNSLDLARFKGNPRVRFILSWNEMYYRGKEYQIEQNKRMLAIASRLVTAGYGVALFGMASDKTLQSEDIEAGVWDSTIDFLIKNSEWAHLDIHEYEVGRLASQHLKAYNVSYPYSIENDFAMRRENWGKIDYSLAANGNWHIGRISWLLSRSKAQFGQDFFWARGEMGWDYKDDGALRAYLPEYSSRYGRPSGLNSLRPLFDALANNQLTDTEFCEEAYADLDWFVSQDPASCLSNAIFADNTGRDHAAFHIGLPQYGHLYTLLGQQKTEDTPMPQLYPASFHSLKVSNVRTANDVNSPILYTLDTNVQSGQIAKEGETMQGSSFTGLAIEFEHPATQATVKGFIAKTKNLVIDYSPTVPEAKHYRLSMNGAEMYVTEAAWPETKKAIQLFAASLDTILPE